jgi:two-component system, response regulator FlrC
MRSVLRFHNRRLVIADDVMVRAIELAGRAAKINSPVLLYGESGTGKELIARYIHEKSPRSSGPFISVNCAAVPEGLLEAEFFGYERGAFTGAISRRVGKFELATDGSLLLDEISEMPLSLQAKLLRVLQEGEVDRLGGRDPVRVNCRIIATTNRDPQVLLNEKSFREDLYYRLNVIRIDCAPLRGRTDAIEALAQEFLRRSTESQGMSELVFTAQAMKTLTEHAWPGNIRELQNAIERAVWLANGNGIEPVHFGLNASQAAEAPGELLSEVERKHILSTIAQSNGNRSEAAEKLGITTRTLRNKLKEYGS